MPLQSPSASDPSVRYLVPSPGEYDVLRSFQGVLAPSCIDTGVFYNDVHVCIRALHACVALKLVGHVWVQSVPNRYVW